jgi:hypothetical protein
VYVDFTSPPIINTNFNVIKKRNLRQINNVGGIVKISNNMGLHDVA